MEDTKPQVLESVLNRRDMWKQCCQYAIYLVNIRNIRKGERSWNSRKNVSSAIRPRPMDGFTKEEEAA